MGECVGDQLSDLRWHVRGRRLVQLGDDHARFRREADPGLIEGVGRPRREVLKTPSMTECVWSDALAAASQRLGRGKSERIQR